MLRFIFTALAMLQLSLFAGVTVLPTQGSVGDEFHFSVTLTPSQSLNCSDVYIRIFENGDDYYDYRMEEVSSDKYKLSITIDEPSVKKEFIMGRVDLHGEIHWESQKHFFRVIDNDFETQTLPQKNETTIDINTVYVADVMKNVLQSLGKKRGYTTWDGIKRYGIWVQNHNTYCARFVRMCFGEERKYGSAIEMYRHYKRENLIQTQGTPPDGAVVFYATRSGYGHVGIADGTGGLFSAASYVNGVKHDERFTSKARYLGYVTAFDFKEFY